VYTKVSAPTDAVDRYQDIQNLRSPDPGLRYEGLSSVNVLAYAARISWSNCDEDGDEDWNDAQIWQIPLGLAKMVMEDQWRDQKKGSVYQVYACG
jgi:hypothetical protein